MGSLLYSEPKDVDRAVQQVLRNERVIYVAKSGDDSNSGLSQLRPKLTFNGALSAAIESGATAIYCFDDGEYNESFFVEIPGFKIFAPFASLSNDSIGTPTLQTKNISCNINFRKVSNTVGVAINHGNNNPGDSIITVDDVVGDIHAAGTGYAHFLTHIFDGEIDDGDSLIRGQIGSQLYGFSSGSDVASVSFVKAATDLNTCEVTIQLKDGAGSNINASYLIDVYLSSSPTGDGITVIDGVGTVSVKPGGFGSDVFNYHVVLETTASKMMRCKTNASGVYVLKIVDELLTHHYVCVGLPNGLVHVSTALTDADYGEE